MNAQPKVIAFRSGDKKFNRSRQHLGLWLVSFPGGGWFSVGSSAQSLMESNPPNEGSIEYSK